MKNKRFRPDFIQVPYIVISHKDTKPLDYLVYGLCYVLEHLSQKKCTASNVYLSEVLFCSAGSIQNSLLRLEKAGFILRKFKDKQKKQRSEIMTLVRYQVSSEDVEVSSENDTVSSEDDTWVSSEDDHIKKSNIKKSYKEEYIAKAQPLQEVPLLIKAFEKINPACKRFYGNTTQRQACEDLISSYGLDKVLTVIEKVLPRTNKEPYMPTINTPHILNIKWADLESALLKTKNKVEKETEPIYW